MFDIAIAALATFGISAIISTYDGPASALVRMRSKVAIARCCICLAVWVAMPIAFFAAIGVTGYLAVLGVVVIIERLT